jgi:hypothetical protein
MCSYNWGISFLILCLRIGHNKRYGNHVKLKSLSDTLTLIGQPLRPEEFTSFVLSGLDEDYDSLVEMLNGVVVMSLPMISIPICSLPSRGSRVVMLRLRFTMLTLFSTGRNSLVRLLPRLVRFGPAAHQLLAAQDPSSHALLARAECQRL